MHLLLILLLTSLTFALPPRRIGPRLLKRFNPEPRSTVDWNTPRGSGNFLSPNPNLHTVEYFSNPPARYSALQTANTIFSRKEPITPRATSGQWESLSGYAYHYPAPVCWGGKRLDLFYMSKDKTCHYKYRDTGHKEPKYQQWGNWEDLGGEMDSAPSVCSRKKENMHVFCKGSDGQAWHRSYDNGWGKWQAMGGKMKHEPASCSWKGGYHAAVYVSAEDGQCWTRKYDEKKSWEGWYNLGGYLAGPPKVVTGKEGHSSVYCKGDDGQAWHRKEEGGKWGDWETIGGSLESVPGAVAWEGSERMDVYVQGTDGCCWHKTYKNETVKVYDEKEKKEKVTTVPKWGAWENLGGEMKEGMAPDVVQVDGGMEVYITGEDDAVYRKKWKDGSWTEKWEPMGGSVESKPSTVKWDDGKVDVYFTGKDKTCKRCY
ncbi:hypothetical protein OQA88_2461 [Cercophora sp. LCS_1]